MQGYSEGAAPVPAGRRPEEEVADAMARISHLLWSSQAEIDALKRKNMEAVEASYDNPNIIDAYADQINVIHDHRIVNTVHFKSPVTHINVPLTPDKDEGHAKKEILSGLEKLSLASKLKVSFKFG